MLLSLLKFKEISNAKPIIISKSDDISTFNVFKCFEMNFIQIYLYYITTSR